MHTNRFPHRVIRQALLLPILLSCSLLATRAASPAKPAASRSAGTLVPWRGLSFQQDGLHNCGTVSMLMAWANRHPGQAAKMVRRLPDSSFRVAFPNPKAGTVAVSPRDIAMARRVRLVRCASGDVWPLAVLTAFARLKSRGAKPDFHATEWIYAGEIARCLAPGASSIFHIKPMDQRKGRISIGAPVALPRFEAHLRRVASRPTVAYNNRCVHIWAVLGYDARRKMVRARNPRRAQSVWMPLRLFRDQFQILVSAPA